MPVATTSLKSNFGCSCKRNSPGQRPMGVLLFSIINGIGAGLGASNHGNPLLADPAAPLAAQMAPRSVFVPIFWRRKTTQKDPHGVAIESTFINDHRQWCFKQWTIGTKMYKLLRGITYSIIMLRLLKLFIYLILISRFFFG